MLKLSWQGKYLGKYCLSFLKILVVSLLSAIPIAQRGKVSPYPSLYYLLIWHQTRQASALGRNQTLHMVVIETAAILKSHRHHDNPSAPFKCT